ncbi:MAG: MFS transporter [Bdellovibrio sp. CG10_big_fil_rev_8_21_14_0_10_47_8]|nr:MAG: MFS transporter [Bdellovibrio sp. CG10_big_fil_rev_8_21_14_0_10_47_8]
MGLTFVAVTLVFVIWLYFRNNPLGHSRKFMIRRFINWFPLGMTYAFLYMGRYNLNVAKNSLGDLMTKSDFGLIFGAGTLVYGLSFLVNGPLVDKLGGKRGMVIAALGACVMNALMGIATYLLLHGRLQVNVVLTFSILYALNMYFQSYGAVSIIKVKAYWFHVRERGVFGAIFGTLISFGVYFAFDWGQAIAEGSRRVLGEEPSDFQKAIHYLFATDLQAVDSIWLVFFIPSFLLIIWAILDIWLLKDSPALAGFDEFDPHDASSGEEDEAFSAIRLLKKILTNPIMLTVALVDFTAGVLRNGVLQWYPIMAKEIPQLGAEWVGKQWGLWLCISGIAGGFSAGWVSDHIFHSRRGPPAAIMNFIMFFMMLGILFFLTTNPMIVGLAAIFVSFAVIGVHSLMSGTAAADFGGRKSTATASGIVDGCVYLGSGLQSISLGYLTTQSWHYWPLFLLPFTVLGMLFAMRMWYKLPEATRRYLMTVENIQVTTGKGFRRIRATKTEISGKE